MHAVFHTNLECQSCVSKVAALLDTAPGVEAWSVDLDDERRPLRVEVSSDAALADVPTLVAEAGFEARHESSIILPMVEPPTAEAKPLYLATYRPLLLVVAYVLGVTILIEATAGGFVPRRAMGTFMGCFFLGFSFFKLLDVQAFANSFAGYDLLAARSRAYALAYPWLEVALGLLFLTRSMPTAANAAALVLMLVGLVGVVRAVRSGRQIQCACLGTAFNLPMSSVTIVENSVMAAMAAWMLLTGIGGP